MNLSFTKRKNKANIKCIGETNKRLCILLINETLTSELACFITNVIFKCIYIYIVKNQYSINHWYVCDFLLTPKVQTVPTPTNIFPTWIIYSGRYSKYSSPRILISQSETVKPISIQNAGNVIYLVRCFRGVNRQNSSANTMLTSIKVSVLS